MKYASDRLVEYETSGHRVAWIVSYADIMTILVTFFIMIISISRISPTRYESLASVFTGKSAGTLHEVKAKTEAIIMELGIEEQVQLTLNDDGLSIALKNSVLFDSGEAALRTSAESLLQPIGAHLAASLDDHYTLIVEGYTDDVPIRTAEFRSNWELSTSRAIYVMETVVAAGFDRRRISVQGFADTRPNHGPDGGVEAGKQRARDRRVILRVVERVVATSPEPPSDASSDASSKPSSEPPGEP